MISASLPCFSRRSAALLVFLALASCGALHTHSARASEPAATFVAAATPAWGNCQATSGAQFALSGGARLSAGRADGCGVALDGNLAEVSLNARIYDGHSISFALDFALDDSTRPQTLVSQDGNNTASLALIYTGPSAAGASGTLALVISNTDTTSAAVQRLTSRVPPMPYGWNHVAVTLDDASGTAQIYVNGALGAEAKVQLPFTPQQGAYLGRSRIAGQATQRMAGRIDNFTWADHVYSAAEVLALATPKAITTPVRAPSLPLAVRDPFNSLWVPADTPVGNLTTFWNGNPLGLVVLARVDGTSYNLVGAAAGAAHQANLLISEVTPAQTRLHFQTGPVQVQLTFTGELDPSDLKGLSNPFTSMLVRVASRDGAQHSVDFYGELTGEFAAGDTSVPMVWSRESLNANAPASAMAFVMGPETNEVLVETSERAAYGEEMWASAGSTLHYQSGASDAVRAQFLANGVLADSDDTHQPRVVSALPVVAFSHNLSAAPGAVAAATPFALGHITQPAVAVVNDTYAPLWQAYWASKELMVADTLSAMTSGTVEQHSALVDRKVLADATALGGSHYAALCSLSMRQAFGATHFANTTDNPYLFVKEISSDGDLSTIDVIYPMMPIFAYYAPELIRYMMAPLLDYVESGQWPEPFAPHDLGVYPNGSGHNDGGGENMPVEETANMLNMAQAYVQLVPQAEGEAWVRAHYATFKGWADYLVSNTLDPAYQNQTDDFAGFIAHCSNLALKGILGLGAMEKLATLVGNTADAQSYGATAQSYITQWAQKSTDPSGAYLNLAYGSAGTWSLKYNAFVDKLLGLNLIPASVLATEQSYYMTKINGFGIPLDSRHTYTKLDWLLWTAATIPDASARMKIIEDAYNYANTTSSRVPLSDFFDTLAGTSNGFQARPVVGGLFSLLARQRAQGDLN